MGKIGRIFLAGLAAVLPIAITLYLLYWIGSSAEKIFGGVLQWLIPPTWYVPGMGVVLGAVVILGVGVLLKAWVIRRIWQWLEGLLLRLPVVKTIYGSIQDLMDFFDKSERERLGQAVMVPLGDTGFEVMGFVTREDFSDVPEGIGAAGKVAVYTPMSYQIGGYTLIVDRERLRPVDFSVEEGMRFAVTAGMAKSRGRRKEN